MKTRTIWIYWDAGLENSPKLIRACVKSWRLRNPGWTIRTIDKRTVSDWVSMEDIESRHPKLTIQAYSDILRWRLLSKHGGVWADATLYCVKPLDSWLMSEMTPRGFFVFRSPEPYLYHSWFIAGNPLNTIVREMDAELNRFFLNYKGFRHYWDMRGVWRIYRLIERLAGRYNHEIWRSHIFRRYFKAAPYFFQNYLLSFP